MMLGLDDIHELTKLGLTNLDVIIIGETIQYKDFMIDGEAVSLINTKYLSKTWFGIVIIIWQMLSEKLQKGLFVCMLELVSQHIVWK